MASDGQSNERFGQSVALDHDTALIGSPGNKANGNLSGSAYIFTRSGGVWTEQFELLPSDGHTWQEFGQAVALDGDTAVVGAPGDDDNGWSSGSTYVFVRAGGVWTEDAELWPSDAEVDDDFGSDLALDGNTAVIGAPYDDDNGSYSGSAYVFTRSGGMWTEHAKLVPTDGSSSDFFGKNVAIDGNTTVIGAYHDDDNGHDSGSAYVFTHTDGAWTEQAKLLPSDGAEENEFGFTVALDGSTALFGSLGVYDNADYPGAAYVFVFAEDPDVPAIGVAGLTVLLLALLGTGAYFLRRRPGM
jgi:predicted amidohydrolase